MRNPFADQVISLIERLTATLPAKQKREFNRWARKPYVYFNQETVTDYLPHRETINTVVDAISKRQQIRFEYTSMQGTMPHEHVDPYYIVHQDGHLYLIGYSHKTTAVLEYRIDRINGESLKIERDTVDVVRRRHPIEFSYWIDGSIAKSGLSQRWLTHSIEREEVYVDEEGKTRRRVLVRAKAYSEWRIIQQLHKYGDKVELVDPLKLREWMRKEVERMYRYYQNGVGVTDRARAAHHWIAITWPGSCYPRIKQPERCVAGVPSRCVSMRSLTSSCIPFVRKAQSPEHPSRQASVARGS